jgi:hypothetical protein
MRIRLQSTIWLFVLAGLLGCEDWDLPELDFIVLKMESITEEAQFLNVTSRITELRRETVDEYGHVWSRDVGVLPTLEDNEGIASFKSLTPEEALAPFTAKIDRRELHPKDRYVFRAYALIGERCFYSDSVLFYQGAPVVVTAENINYSAGTSAVAEGRIFVQNPNVRVVDYGHCWGTGTAIPKLGQDRCTSFGGLIASEKSFSSTIAPLEDGQVYTIVPYAVIRISDNETDTCYGAPLRFEARLNQFWKVLDTPQGLSAKEGAIAFTFGDTVAFIAGGVIRDLNGLTFLDDCWRYSTHGGWRPCKENMPAPLAYGVVFTIGQKAYIGTGQKVESAPLDTVVTGDFYAFNMEEETWQTVSPLPEPRLFAVGFSSGGAGFAGTGLREAQAIGGSREMWRYLPEQDRWEPAQTFGVRYGMASFRVNGVVYLGGGFDEQGIPSPAFWRFDGAAYEPAGLKPGPSARGFAVGFSDAAGSGFLSLGIDSAFKLLTDVQRLSPGAPDWEPVADFPAQGRIFGIGFSLEHQWYMGLGATPDGRPLGDLWVYTPE